MKSMLRIKANQEFQSILKTQVKVGNSCYFIYYRENTQSHARFGISASKKLGNAVIRGRVRRQIRAMIQELLKKEDNIEKKDYIILVRHSFLKNDFQTNYKEIEILFHKVRRKTHEKMD